MNVDQLAVLDFVKSHTMDAIPYTIYIDGPGGTGKTYILNTIITFLHSVRKKVVVVASTGVAALLLDGGETAHSGLGIPLELEPDQTYSWTSFTKLGRKLLNTDVIVWDEISVQNRNAVEAVERSLRNLRNTEAPFGGVSVIFAGDFRQTLPIVKRGNILDQSRACMKSSPLWDDVVIFRLRVNMRLLMHNISTPELLDQSRWLLDVGEGKLQESDTSHVELLHCQTIHSNNDQTLLRKIIFITYNNLRAHIPHMNLSDQQAYFTERCILCPLNVNVRSINEHSLQILPGTMHSSYSLNHNADLGQENLPEEVLNTLSIPNFPEHLIKLKIGFPVILLRNLNVKAGLCNGTRLIVTDIQPHTLACVILNGSKKGTKVVVPKIRLLGDGKDGVLAQFYRYQFPISLAFSMTINKAQGQSLKHVGVMLPKPVFAHGQLYVALSRVMSFDNLTVALLSPESQTRTLNIVKRDLLVD